MKRIPANDRNFAVICYGSMLKNSKDINMSLMEICSESITTKSNLLIHHVLQQIDEKGGRAWKRFVNDVTKKAAFLKNNS